MIAEAGACNKGGARMHEAWSRQQRLLDEAL